MIRMFTLTPPVIDPVRMRFLIQDEINDLEEESYQLTSDSWYAIDTGDVEGYERMTKEADKCQARINKLMLKLQATD